MEERGAAARRRVVDHALLGPLPAAEAIALTFDGQPVEARAGEPLLAALLAAGIRSVRTMPNGGERRGGWCLVGRCTDCLVVVDGVPNVRACVEAVRAGMRVETQHGLAEEAALAAPFTAAGEGDR